MKFIFLFDIYVNIDIKGAIIRHSECDRNLSADQTNDVIDRRQPIVTEFNRVHVTGKSVLLPAYTANS